MLSFLLLLATAHASGVKLVNFMDLTHVLYKRKHYTRVWWHSTGPAGETPLRSKSGEFDGKDGLFHWGDGQIDLARWLFFFLGLLPFYPCWPGLRSSKAPPWSCPPPGSTTRCGRPACGQPLVAGCGPWWTGRWWMSPSSSLPPIPSSPSRSLSTSRYWTRRESWWTASRLGEILQQFVAWGSAPVTTRCNFVYFYIVPDLLKRQNLKFCIYFLIIISVYLAKQVVNNSKSIANNK